jgi:hypothetical protein
MKRLAQSGAKYIAIKSHVPTPTIKRLVMSGEAKAFYVYRDLRGVALSTMWKHNIRFENVWQSDTLSNAVEWCETWESLPGIYTTDYYSLIYNMRLEVEYMADFLRIPCSALLAGEIANAHSIKNQKQIIAKLPDAVQFHPSELLHKGHIGQADGQVNQWKNHLTRTEIGAVEGRYRDWLAGHGYELMIS